MIARGGIVGLTLALMLHRQAIDCLVLETAAEVEPLGLTTSPNPVEAAAARERARGIVAREGKPALAWTKSEELSRAAVQQWSVFQNPPYLRWTLSIDGHQRKSLSGPSARVIHALLSAYPLPATITEAAAEYARWNSGIATSGWRWKIPVTASSILPPYFRQDIVRRLLETELRAASLAEVLIRQRHLSNSEVVEPDIERAVLLDLEWLARAKTGQVASSEAIKAQAQPEP